MEILIALIFFLFFFLGMFALAEHEEKVAIRRIKQIVHEHGGVNIYVQRSGDKRVWSFNVYYTDSLGNKRVTKCKIHSPASNLNKPIYWTKPIVTAQPSATKQEHIIDTLERENQALQTELATATTPSPQPSSSKEQIIDELSTEVARLQTELVAERAKTSTSFF